MNAWCIGVIIFVSLAVFICIVVLLCSRNNESFEQKKRPIPNLKWPFLNLEDQNGKKINILVIRAYLDSEESRKKMLDLYNDGWKFIGCSSNQSFPRCCDNPHGTYANCKNKDNQKIGGKDIEEYVMGWCHCFREPEKYIKHNIPLLLCSESDFNALDLVKLKPAKKKKYDYICVQPKNNPKCTPGWHHYYKNWPLCEKVIKVLSDEMGLKGLVIGWEDCPIHIKNKKLVKTTGFLEYFEFIQKLRESKFLLLPNLEEASPRIETEAMAADVPIFVYENILGGWKYVNNETGVFFNEKNIKKKAQKMMNNIKAGNVYHPRKHYTDNYDKVQGKILRDWLKELYPEMTDCEWVKFAISSG